MINYEIGITMLTLKVETFDGFCEMLLLSFDVFGTISTSSEDVTVTPLMVTDVGAPISRIGTHGVETGAGLPYDATPL